MLPEKSPEAPEGRGKFMESLPPEEWFNALENLKEGKGIVLLLGATDTGKSTLAKFLLSQLCKKGMKVALVDADIGQSFLGPPTTIGLALFKSDPVWEIVLSTPEIFFVGSTTPESHFPIHLKGVKRMVDKATSYDADVIVVDTTGFVLGEGGKELKRRKIDLVSPRFIFALQKSDEIEPILEYYQENPLLNIYRLPLSQQVRSRSMEERKIYRANRFQDYFKYSVIHEMAINEFRVEGEVFDPNGEPIPLDWSLRINGLLIGLKDINDDTLSLAVIRNYIEEKRVVRILTPLRDIQGVKTVQLSSLKVIPYYEEERF
jgi:polynucleotide 5'-hydroxyl-kinase GRC3/NOL9